MPDPETDFGGMSVVVFPDHASCKVLFYESSDSTIEDQKVAVLGLSSSIVGEGIVGIGCPKSRDIPIEVEIVISSEIMNSGHHVAIDDVQFFGSIFEIDGMSVSIPDSIVFDFGKASSMDGDSSEEVVMKTASTEVLAGSISLFVPMKGISSQSSSLSHVEEFDSFHDHCRIGTKCKEIASIRSSNFSITRY